MRLWLSLLLLCTTCAAFRTEFRFNQNSHPNYYPDLEESSPSLHQRFKRAIFATLGIGSQCEAGWTGDFCNYPICNAPAAVPRIPSYPNRLIDQLYLPSGCKGKYYIPFDGNSVDLNINVAASGMPYINLTDSDGNLVVGSQTVFESVSIAQYASLKPGGYQLTIDNGGVPTVDCIVEIQAFSFLAAVQGFVVSPQSDDVPNGDTGIDSLPMYIVAHVANLTGPGTLKSVTVRSEKSMDPVYRSVITPRYGCGYEYYAGQFVCDMKNKYIMHIDGTDNLGYPFRRSSAFYCMQQITTPAPTTPPLTSCFNGGTILRSGTVNASCFCPELYTGRQCEQVNCMNGGFPAPSGLECTCHDGYWGANCQHLTCDPNFGQFLTDYKSLVVVIRATASMAPYINGISNAIYQAVQNGAISGDNIYKEYLLVRFGDDQYIYKSYSQFTNFMNDLQQINSTTLAGGCNDTTFDAIYSVFEEPVYDKSPIFLITDAVAKDSRSWRKVTEANSRRKLPIYSLFLSSSSCNFDVMNTGYRAISDAAYFSGGLSFLPPDGNALANILRLVMTTTTYKMNQVYADDPIRCGSGSSRSFMIDSSTTDIFIIVTGNNAQVTIVDPNQSQYKPQPMYTDNYNYIYEVLNVQVGEYLLFVLTANPQDSCSIRVVSRSNYDLFFATSEFAYIDAMDSEPVVGQATHLVAQLNGLVNATRDPFRLFAELMITTNLNNNNNQPQQPMYFSNGIYRDGCGYHLYFGVANFCQFDNQPFYATVFADDNNGFTIQRTTIGFCSLTPTTTAPPGSCQNGGVMDPNNNSSCICRVNYAGQYCESPICQNGGTPAGSFCYCIPGTGGSFCELLACTAVNPYAAFNPEQKSMAWVVSTRTTMASIWQQLAGSVGDFVRDCQNESPTWINQWVLIITNQDEAQVIVKSSTAQDFVDGVTKVANNLGNYQSTNPNCSVQLEEGIQFATYYSEPDSNIYVFTDSDGPDVASQFLDIYTKTAQYRLTVNMIVGDNFCSLQPDGQVSEHIQDLVYSTNGFVYYTSHITEFIPFITASYMSQVSAMVGDPAQCAPYVGYFAVDGWTESFTIATTGGNITDVKITFPDGSLGRNDPAEITMISDPYLNLVQFMTPCPMTWKSTGQYCLGVEVQKLGWSQASVKCHQGNSWLVDIFSQDKNNVVHFQIQNTNAWIGLIRNGDHWVWDVPDGNHYAILNTTYANWCPNFPTADTTKNCVIMTADACWQNIDCNTANYFICQKHRYGQGIYPGDVGNNVLPGGRYRIEITSSGGGGCFAQIRSQSQLLVNYGFVNDPHSDYPERFGNIDSNTNYVVAHTSNLFPFSPDTNPSLEGRLNYALLGFNNTLTNALPLNNRWFCGYEMVSGAFSCPANGGDFYIKFSGIDQYGFAFDRYVDSQCSKFASTCFNGGFSNNGQCVCRPGYTGSRCTTPICQNGGVERDGTCSCQPMFGGTFCEEPFCEPIYPATFKDQGKTLAIILETSYNMGSTIFQLKRNLKKTLDAIKADPTTAGWFTEFILYPFDSTTNKMAWYNVTVSNNSDDIVNAINAIPTMTCPGTNACSAFCPRPILTVLNNVLTMKEFTSPNSVVLVVTRSTPEDFTSIGDMETILQQTRAQVNFILPAIDSPCGEGWNTPAANTLYKATSYSDGNVFVMSPVDFATNFLSTYLPSLYRSAGLETNSNGDCSYMETLFQVEHSMYEFTIDYYIATTNPPMQVQIWNPAGELISLPPNLISSDNNYLGVVSVNDTGLTRAGTYKVAISSGGGQFCMLNVRGRSGIEIYPGFVNSNYDAYNGATADNAYFAPTAFVNNSVVVHVDGEGVHLTYAQIVVPYFGLRHTAALKRRDKGCSYEYYSTVPFECSYDSTILLVIYGQDSQGAVLRRNYILSCIDNAPTPKPPPARCDMTAVVQDTLFIIDSSLKDSNFTFNTLANFAATSQRDFKLGSNFTQVSAITLADVAKNGFNYLASTSYMDLTNKFNALPYQATAGQNLTSAFQMVIDNFSDSTSGYRTGIRHLIVYVTNTIPTDVDPGQLLYGIRRGGSYGFAIVGLELTNTAALENIVTNNCLYNADSFNDLFSSGVNFIQLLACSRNSVCGM